jgi:hypothetical protein
VVAIGMFWMFLMVFELLVPSRESYRRHLVLSPGWRDGFIWKKGLTGWGLSGAAETLNTARGILQ